MCGGPVGDILDTTSSVLGTDGGDGGILGAVEDVGQSIGSGLAAIDPGPAIGSGLADVDEFVNEEIPGGWVTVGLAAATAGAASSLGAGAGAAAGAEAGAGAIATEAGQSAFFNALATGATSAEAVSAGLAADAALGAGALSAEQLLSSGGFTPIPGSEANFVVPGAVETGSSLLGPTYGELGLTGVEGGLAGPTYGELGVTGLETGSVGAGGAPVFDYSQEVILSPGGNYIPANTLPSEIAGLDAEILKAGEAAIKAAPVSISPSQAIQGVRMASGLLGGQQGTPAGAAAQFRGSTMPQGAVDYSGILNLLQTRSPQRNPYSLLG
jgi:hypothetical protein